MIEQNRKKIEEGLKTVKLTLHDGIVHSALMIHAVGGGIQTDQMFYARPDIARIVIKGKFQVWEYMGAGFFLGIAYRLAAYIPYLHDIPLIASETSIFKSFLYHGVAGAVPCFIIGALVNRDRHYDFTRSDRDKQWTSFVEKYGR